MYPVTENILREEVVIDRPHLARISIAAIIQIGICWEWNSIEAAELIRSHRPRIGKSGKFVAVFFAQPSVPRCQLTGIAVRPVAMKDNPRVREARLVDQIPRKPRYVFKSFHHGPHISL